ncbi:MAG: glycine cleavage system aminomethyltransferase GcvT [Planctomycetota bacterium]|nr:MAG: glycine cleavage system aminomethyltransferase GcvT [Planctomycetota bacterium]
MQRTALYQLQVALGGRFVDFAGWEMPVQFAGILAEHQAVRSACGLFDLGHMGRLRLQGPAALDFLDSEICRPLSGMRPGQVRYGLICEDDGGVVDDVLVSCEGPESYHVVVNASNLATVRGRWQQAAAAGLEIEDLSQVQQMIALQGPQSVPMLKQLGIELPPLRTYHFTDLHWRGHALRLSRTGYTGEDGFECFASASALEVLWSAFISAGVQPCGLGARDLLRLEAGMPLYGHELDRQHSPVEAGLRFAVGSSGSYRGHLVLQRQLQEGTPRRLVGLDIPGKRPAREGYAVLHQGAEVGVVTSGGFSPLRQAGVAMAYVPSQLAEPGQELQISLRGKAEVPATVVPLPFYRRPKS